MVVEGGGVVMRGLFGLCEVGGALDKHKVTPKAGPGHDTCVMWWSSTSLLSIARWLTFLVSARDGEQASTAPHH